MPSVQTKSLRDFGITEISVAFTSNVTAGSVICGFVFWNSATITLNSVGDGTRTFTLLDNPTTLSSAVRAAMFYYENHPGGATTVTATFSASVGNSTIFIHEATGLLTSGSLDQHVLNAQTAPGTGGDAVTSTSVTTTGNNEYCAGFTVERSGGGALTAGTGWTQRESGTNIFMSEDQVQTSAGPIAATFTISPSDQVLTGIMTFKSAPTGPAATVSGTITGGTTESHIVAGGRTIVVTLSNSTLIQ